MSNDSPPGSSRPAAGGEFTWPPTSDELDAIQVITLDDTSSVKPIAVAPATAMVAPAFKRGGRLRLPRRDDLVLAGVTISSMLAIATAAFMQFSDTPRTPAEPRDPPIASLATTVPLTTTSLPMMSPIAAAPLSALDKGTSTPPRRSVARVTAPPARIARARARRLASRAVERRRVTPVSEDYARPRLIAPERGRNGKVVLSVEVRKNGKVGDVDVLSSNLDRDNRSHRDLQRAAVSTVKRWRYTPAIRDGEPTETRVRVVVDINLDSARVIGASTEADARRKGAAANRVADSVRAAR